MSPTSQTLSPQPAPIAQPEQGIAETIARERGRLRRFISQRVSDPGEAEDVLQDVLFALVEAWRLPDPIEQVGAWLFRVARNRIVDGLRKKREIALPPTGDGEDEEGCWLDLALPAVDGDPEAAYLRATLLEALAAALAELPAGQRGVFIAHELDGRSFKELAAQSGMNVNTLLGWKRLAVLHLRDRLRPLYAEYSW